MRGTIFVIDVNLFLSSSPALVLQEAAIRAVKNALQTTALPGVVSMVPGGHEKVKIKCKIGVPDSVGSCCNI